VHLTNTHLSKAIFETTKQNQSSTVTEEELRDYQMWTLEDLQDYLLKTVNFNFFNSIPHQFSVE